MKKTSALILALALVFVSSFSAFSFKISFDGADNGIEWLEAEIIHLLSNDSHSGIRTAFLRYYVDFDSYDIWMLVQIKDDAMERDDKDIKIILYAEDERIEILPYEGYKPVNVDKYTVEAKSYFDMARGMSSEIRLGIKNGIPDGYKFRIQFADSSGTLSNIKDIIIRNPEETTTEAEETESEAERTKAPPTTKKERTTKEKTTRLRTTRVTTTKITTTRPPKTTKAKTTVAPKPVALPSAQATASEASTEPSTQSLSTTALETVTETELVVSEVSKAISSSEKYKTAIFASAAVALILIVSLSALSAKKKEE